MKKWCMFMAAIFAACLFLGGCEYKEDRTKYHYAGYYSADEYKVLYENGELTPNYIPPECLELIGDFTHYAAMLGGDHNYLCQKYIRKGGKSILQTELEFAVFQDKYHIYSQNYSSIKKVPDPENMLYLPDYDAERDGYFHLYEKNNVRYEYRNGTLDGVRWIYNDIQYNIRINVLCRNSDYNFTNKFIKKLKDTQSGEVAIQELMEAIYPDEPFTGLQRIETWSQRNWRIASYIGGGVLAVAVVMVPTVLLIKRRKGKKEPLDNDIT